MQSIKDILIDEYNEKLPKLIEELDDLLAIVQNIYAVAEEECESRFFLEQSLKLDMSLDNIKNLSKL